MDKNIETMLMECHILMSEALKGYEDRAYISNKLFEIRQYRNKLPEDIYGKIKEFADKNIRPMAYDVDFWSFMEELVGSKKKKYVRYAEGAELYSMGLHSFQEIAKEAGAVRKVRNVAIEQVKILAKLNKDA